MSAFATIAYEVADEIATITLDRPDRLSALDPTMERELLQVWDLVDADDAVRAVVVTGRGRAFCAGADLTDAGAGFDVVRRAQMRGTEELRPDDVPRDSGGLISLRLFRCLKPVIAAINDAAEALEAGLARSVHPPDELLPAAYAMARQIIERSAPVSVALNRQLLWQMAGAAHPMDAYRQESIYIAQRGPSADADEGARSFLEKRAPRFPLQVSADLPAATPWQVEPPRTSRR